MIPHPSFRILGFSVVVLLLMQGCSTAPDEPIQEQTAPVAVQGERLDAPLAASPQPTLIPAAPVIDQVNQGLAVAKVAPMNATASFPLNATGQRAVDALIGTVAPPSATAMLAEKKPISATAELAKATSDALGYRRIPFDILAGYEYMIPTLVVDKETEEQLKDQIPDYIKALDDSKVSLEGYMVPLDIEDEKVKSFILTNSMMLCCFGSMPWINEWVYVEMDEGHAADFFNDTVIRVSGVLDVGEEIEDGIVLSLYRMQGQDVKSEGKPLNYLFKDYKEY